MMDAPLAEFLCRSKTPCIFSMQHSIKVSPSQVLCVGKCVLGCVDPTVVTTAPPLGNNLTPTRILRKVKRERQEWKKHALEMWTSSHFQNYFPPHCKTTSCVLLGVSGGFNEMSGDIVHRKSGELAACFSSEMRHCAGNGIRVLQREFKSHHA